jgi:hypothetical protein
LCFNSVWFCVFKVTQIVLVMCHVDAVAYVVIALLLKPKKKRKKRVWMKEWLKIRNKFTHEILLNELRASEPNDFKNFVRLDAVIRSIIAIG